MKRDITRIVSLLVLSLILHSPSYASIGTTSGINLLRSQGARPSALGDAFTAEVNDVQAFGYNPAALSSLKRAGTSLMYEKGAVDDSFAQFVIGTPVGRGAQGLGFSVGYYRLGDFGLFDGQTTQTVNAKTDLIVTAGYSSRFGNTSFGTNVKYISSELLETYTANAMAVDFGLQQALSSRFVVGAALQNLGSKLRYDSESYDLPQLARAGMKWNFLQASPIMSIYADSSYLIQQSELRPAVGLESVVGPLALRVGYKRAGGGNELSFGTGFTVGSMGLDYTYGLTNDQFNAQNQVSVSFLFGGVR